MIPRDMAALLHQIKECASIQYDTDCDGENYVRADCIAWDEDAMATAILAALDGKPQP